MYFDEAILVAYALRLLDLKSFQDKPILFIIEKTLLFFNKLDLQQTNGSNNEI